MQLNSFKCHILTLTVSANLICSHITSVEQLGLSSVHSYPYLGITVSSDLPWDKHVYTVSSKTTRHLNFIRHDIYGCPPEG